MQVIGEWNSALHCVRRPKQMVEHRIVGRLDNGLELMSNETAVRWDGIYLTTRSIEWKALTSNGRSNEVLKRYREEKGFLRQIKTLLSFSCQRGRAHDGSIFWTKSLCWSLNICNSKVRTNRNRHIFPKECLQPWPTRCAQKTAFFYARFSPSLTLRRSFTLFVVDIYVDKTTNEVWSDHGVEDYYDRLSNGQRLIWLTTLRSHAP